MLRPRHDDADVGTRVARRRHDADVRVYPERRLHGSLLWTQHRLIQVHSAALIWARLTAQYCVVCKNVLPPFRQVSKSLVTTSQWGV